MFRYALLPIRWIRLPTGIRKPSITIREPVKSEKVTINEYKLKSSFSAAELQTTSIPVYFENVKYVFDGKVKPSTTPAPSSCPTATPSNLGGGSGGTPSGAGSTNPSQNTISLQVVADLGSLKLEAEANLNDYKADYAAASTAEEKAAIEAEDRSYYNQVVDQFNTG